VGKAEKPSYEPQRLRALAEAGILDTPEEEAFDLLTRSAAALFDTPIALVSLVDENRQWFKSHHGLEARETERDHAFCAHAILDSDSIMVVPDTTDDDRFRDNELVTGFPGIRFYAGAPILSKEGMPLGTFCVIDTRRREAFRPSDEQRLRDFASMASNEIIARRDIADLNERNAALEASKAGQAEILTLIGHDLRSVFNTLLGFSSLLSNIDPETEVDTIRRYVSIIAQAGGRGYQLMDNLVGWARDNLDGIEVEAGVHDLQEITSTALGTLRFMAELKDVKIEDQTGKSLVLVDPFQIAAVIRNLVSNAIKFSHEKSTVVITTVPEKNRVRLSVSDTGAGMMADTVAMVRDLGLNESLSGTAGEQGSGIGLMLCQSFLRRHGSVLEVRSEPGQGTVVSFTLPLAEAETS
jgi:signal transduction histidine kinase